MRLDELKWGLCKYDDRWDEAQPAANLFMYRARRKLGTSGDEEYEAGMFCIYDHRLGPRKRDYLELDPITAQALLIELLREVSDAPG